MSSYLLDKSTALRAIALVEPLIRRMMKSKSVKRKDLHIVILDPTDGLLLTEYSFGDSSRWEHPYHLIARSKALVAMRTKADSITVQTQMPWKYLRGESGETPYGGGVYRDGIVVGVSGVRWYFDQMFAEMIAAALKAFCLEKMQAELAKDEDFLSQD